MFRQQYDIPKGGTLTCPECKGKRFLLKGSKATCQNCGWTMKGAASNKFGAIKTEYNGKRYDSKYEAGVAAELDLRLRTGDILEVIPQFKVEMWAYRENGLKAFMVKHKIDFRIQLRDGSYELVEAKGRETPDYVWRRKFLENIWLPDHPDYVYRVVKQHG